MLNNNYSLQNIQDLKKKTTTGRALPTLLFIVTFTLVALVFVGWFMGDTALLSAIGIPCLIMMGITVIYCLADIFDKLPRFLHLIILLGTLGLLQSCRTEPADGKVRINRLNYKHVETVRSCDYIYIGGGLCHAGDCPNPIHYQMIDMPEEYMEISQDKAHPDTMLAFRDNNITYISFKPHGKTKH